MTTSTYQQKDETYSKATEDELVKARELIAEAKKRVKANPPKTAQEAWAKFDAVRQKIIESINNKDN